MQFSDARSRRRVIVSSPSHISSVVAYVALALAVPAALASAAFPRVAGIAAVALLLVAVASHLICTGSSGLLGTWTSVPMAILVMVMIPISLWTTPWLWEVSWPRAVWLVWAIVACIVVSGMGDSTRGGARSQTRALTWGFLIVGGVLGVIGVLGAEVARVTSAATRVGLPEIVRPNETAGTLLLFLPMAVLLSLAPVSSPATVTRGLPTPGAGPTAQVGVPALAYRVTMGLIVAVFLGMIAVTGSRGGLLFGAVGVAAVLPAIGKRGWQFFGAGVLLTGIGLATLGRARIAELILNTGVFQRTSMEAVLTGRPGIWRSAVHAIADFPFTGIGLGTFGSAGQQLYSNRFDVALEDAHNLFLQSALDVGLLGLLAFLWVLAAAAFGLRHIYRHTRRHEFERYWALGAAASLVAHLLYSLTDSVSFGTLGNAALWLLLGLIFLNTEKTSPLGEPSRTRPASALKALGVVGVIAALVVAATASPAFRYNLAARTTLQALSADSAGVRAAIHKLQGNAGSRCGAHWMVGVLAHRIHDTDGMGQAWSEAIACDGRYVARARRKVPNHVSLAHASVTAQPEVAESHFWLAGLMADTLPERAIELYQRGLSLSPRDGLRWRHLGDLLRQRDRDAAIAAFLQSCLHGDPGSNGCWRAGMVAEENGDTLSAIEYYRRSRWDGARHRADSLETAMARRLYR